MRKLGFEQANEMIAKEKITGGMIPKVKACISAIEKGVSSAHIINGLDLDSLLGEVMTENGTGTIITRN